MCSNNGFSNFTHGFSGGLLGSAKCPPPKRFLIEMLSEVLILSMTQAINSCSQGVSVVQTIQAECEPSVDTIFEANEVCSRCLDTVREAFRYRHGLEVAQWENHAVRVRTPIAQDYAELEKALRTCGKVYCKACDFTNLHQRFFFLSTDGNTVGNACREKGLTKTDIESQLDTALTTLLTEDVRALGALSNMLKATTATEVKNELKSRMQNTISNTFISELNNSLISNQNVKLTAETGISVRSYDSGVMVKQMSQSIREYNVVSSIFTDEEWELGAKILDQHTSISEAGEMLFAPILGLTEVLDSLTGKIMLAAIGILGAILLFIGGAMFFRRMVPTVDDVSSNPPDTPSPSFETGEGTVGFD